MAILTWSSCFMQMFKYLTLIKVFSYLSSVFNFGLLFSCLYNNCNKKKCICGVKWKEETSRKKIRNIYEDKSHFQVCSQHWRWNKTQQNFKQSWLSFVIGCLKVTKLHLLPGSLFTAVCGAWTPTKKPPQGLALQNPSNFVPPERGVGIFKMN